VRPLDDSDIRIGFARDRHGFGPGAPLALGGIEMPGPRLSGHSDGDVALHAVAGALLGAAGLRDLGQLFPADARTPTGVPSGKLLRSVVEELSSAGHRPLAVDVTIEAGRPRLAPELPAMRDAIAGLLGIDPRQVGIKASTGNLRGDEGAGRAISATAVATVGRAR
jgi:2-C-methyl-D-erythritol 2,4-cyclodiphosphate synthase